MLSAMPGFDGDMSAVSEVLRKDAALTTYELGGENRLADVMMDLHKSAAMESYYLFVVSRTRVGEILAMVGVRSHLFLACWV